MAVDFLRGFFSVPIIELAIEAAPLAASLMVCMTVSVTDGSFFREAAGLPDLAELAAALAPAAFAALDGAVAALELPALDAADLAPVAAPDLAAPDLAGPDLAAPDLVPPNIDFAAFDEVAAPDFAAPDFTAPLLADAAFEALIAGAADPPLFGAPDFDTLFVEADLLSALLPALLFTASPAVFAAALAGESLPLAFLGAAFAAPPVFDAPPFAVALALPPSVVAAFGPVDVAFAAGFFAAILVPSPIAAQTAGRR